MGAREKSLERIRLANLAENERLFRINAGEGWTGEARFTDDGVIIIRNPRRFHAAPAGWPDLAGWTTIEITPDMVGQRVAVFTGEELKTGRQRTNPDQERFRAIVERMGGIFRVVREEGEQ